MTQRDRIRKLFTDNPYRWIALPEILYMGIAQYNARIHELRHDGMNIKNKWKIVDGVKHSSFMYVPELTKGTQGNLWPTSILS